MWQPSANKDILKRRADILKQIRAFFAKRQVLEVETPILSHATVPDPYIQSFSTEVLLSGKKKDFYMQTSPEFHMKRLLAAGIGSIYQINKAFRTDEQGRFHNPEFTMLEWYRVGFNHHQLMDEMDELLQQVLSVTQAIRLTYAEVFEEFCGLNPHTASIHDLRDSAKEFDLKINDLGNDKDDWLFLLMSHLIEPQLGKSIPVFIYDFPASQAALAKIQMGNPPVAERFEVYFKGIELANGFHELTNAEEQKKRFLQDIEEREQKNLPVVPLDNYFIEALSSGLPNCAGVALGIDRLIMLACQCSSIDEVISFSWERA
ncbi:MAG: elongation factor P--(R)-beta-lysine ligase [Proteobacteria bacterium]|nr:elongation factor P--(R)-beta-lysine ligase [Pseudomonadota bacterium]